ncbi:hypothetical protein [Bradyrhizobium archetypum]|uniref:Glycosyltransferase RgtA/B/C/D-like domain-containing protein n=1 Tax=Bradyrhizobium archetypum TaxID=2721160 RepID=A0A7Y4HAH8_9BRAD|nr:hypothetical protein [Bradyrhizobium archetypum]NOJ50676.1 hypothetical protein [Bradyrhizobium archetypum]
MELASLGKISHQLAVDFKKRREDGRSGLTRLGHSLNTIVGMVTIPPRYRRLGYCVRIGCISTARKGVSKTSALAGWLERFALGACVVAAMLLLVWVLSSCRSGFDFTDEGFYLNWISSPWNYRDSVTQFGFVYHPLYRVLGGDIALLRQANILIIFGSAFALCASLLHSIAAERNDGESRERIWIVALALVIAANSLTFFDLWLPTPNYNSLTFTALIFAAIGVQMTSRGASTLSLTGWILVGTAGALSFLAKPTSAAVLGCVVLVYLIAAGKLWMRGLVISVVVAAVLLLGSALAIDGSLGRFVDRVLNGARVGALLTPDQPIARMFRMDSFSFGKVQQVIFLLLLAVTFAATFLATRAGAAARVGAAVTAIALTGLSIAASTRAVLPNIPHYPFQPMYFWAINFAVVLSFFFASQWSSRLPSRNSVALAAFLVTLPYVYAFGTGNNYWEQGGRAGLFWLLGSIVIGAELSARNAVWRSLTPITAGALLVTTGVVLTAIANPYRQTQQLLQQTNETEIGPNNATLFLTDEAATYTRNLRRIAADNGLSTGDPLLDLSGRSPGSVYAMGARPPGASWILAGYTGSNQFFIAALASESCDVLAAMWILTEPGLSTAFSANLLQRYGIDILRDYKEVGSVRSVRDVPLTEFEQFVLKPTRTRDAARQACERARQINR